MLRFPVLFFDLKSQFHSLNSKKKAGPLPAETCSKENARPMFCAVVIGRTEGRTEGRRPKTIIPPSSLCVVIRSTSLSNQTLELARSGIGIEVGSGQLEIEMQERECESFSYPTTGLRYDMIPIHTVPPFCSLTCKVWLPSVNAVFPTPSRIMGTSLLVLFYLGNSVGLALHRIHLHLLL